MNTCKRHRFPSDIISYAVWLYYGFNLSHRDIEDLLAERGVDIHKSVEVQAWEDDGNDIIYGGLGDDFLHGGFGDDAISGAEAVAQHYHSAPRPDDVITDLEVEGIGEDLMFVNFKAEDPRDEITDFILKSSLLHISQNTHQHLPHHLLLLL